jgi:hypothetical protein
MNKILRFIYNRYQKIFSSFLVEDFVGQIPKSVRDNALAVFEERKDSLTKYFLWQSFIIQRKAVNDLRKADFYLGMLTNIKMYLTILDAEKVPVVKEKESKKITPRPDISNELNAVEKFKKGLKK